jgi:hypothetical protein
MSKMTLHLDALRVESFDTHPATRGAGTVAAHNAMIGEIAVGVPDTQDVKGCLDSWINTCVTAKITECGGNTCDGALTCGASCKETCETCWGPTCITACIATCASGGDICCA